MLNAEILSGYLHLSQKVEVFEVYQRIQYVLLHWQVLVGLLHIAIILIVKSELKVKAGLCLFYS